MFNLVTDQTSNACTFALDAMGNANFDALGCFADQHGVAVALAILFAFCGAVFFSPSAIK